MIEKVLIAYYQLRYRCIQLGFASRYWHHGIPWGDAMSLGAFDTVELWERECLEATRSKRLQEEQAK